MGLSNSLAVETGGTVASAKKYRVARPTWIKMKRLEGIEIAESILSRCVSDRTLVYFDPDQDGLMAGLFICQYLKAHGVRYQTYCNTNRQHGFSLTGADVEGWTVVNGDFLVTREQVEDIVVHGASIVSFDHHECEPDFIHVVGKDGAEGIVINNQYPFEDERNRFQSGAGVTFEALREMMPELDTKTNRALVGSTILSDVRDLSAPGAWPWLYELYTHGYHGYIRYLIDEVTSSKDWTYGFPRMDQNFVNYTLAPKLNSLFRFNEEDLAVDFILGAGYPPVDYQARQSKLVASLISKGDKREYEGLVTLGYRAADFGEDFNVVSNFVGLVASEISGGGRSSIVYCYGLDGKVERASFRANIGDVDYLQALSGVVDGEGHGVAFGIHNLEPSDELFSRIGKICKKVENGVVFEVKYVSVYNLRDFVSSQNIVLAEKNCYRNSSDRVRLKYDGVGVKEVYLSDRYCKYEIDGVEVVSFNKDYDPEQDLIILTLEKGRPRAILDYKFNPANCIEIEGTRDGLFSLELP